MLALGPLAVPETRVVARVTARASATVSVVTARKTRAGGGAAAARSYREDLRGALGVRGLLRMVVRELVLSPCAARSCHFL